VNDLGDFSLGWVLSEGAKEVTQGLARHGAGTALVEESECLLVLCVVAL